MTPIDVAFAALCDAGRRDLALEITGWEDEGGFYVECDAVVLSEADWALVDKAEALGRALVGLSPRDRGGAA